MATADRERRSLECDLHDGAQTKVVALALALRLARLRSSTGGASSVRLLEAEDEAAAALAELRVVARGLFPTELADEGLEAALESFSESTPNPIAIDALLPGRIPASVESVAFFSWSISRNPDTAAPLSCASATMARRYDSRSTPLKVAGT